MTSSPNHRRARVFAKGRGLFLVALALVALALLLAPAARGAAQTDAAAEPNVKIVGTFPEDSHPPIIYPAAVTRGAKSADAKPFLDHLKTIQARPAFEKQGFTVLVKSVTSA